MTNNNTLKINTNIILSIEIKICDASAKSGDELLTVRIWCQSICRFVNLWAKCDFI